jgi:phage-related tail fiber protein
MIQNGTNLTQDGARDAVKKQCRVVATTNLAQLEGLQMVDGVIVAANDRVLVSGQTDKTKNGIYVVAIGAWTRVSDADTNDDFNPAFVVWVSEGASYHDTGWALITNAPIELGATEIEFAWYASSTGTIPHGGTHKGGGSDPIDTVLPAVETTDVAGTSGLANPLHALRAESLAVRSVRLVATTAVDVNNVTDGAIDGVSLVVGEDTVLLAAQGDQTQNGIYRVVDLGEGVTGLVRVQDLTAIAGYPRSMLVIATEEGGAQRTAWLCARNGSSLSCGLAFGPAIEPAFGANGTQTQAGRDGIISVEQMRKLRDLMRNVVSVKFATTQALDLAQPLADGDIDGTSVNSDLGLGSLVLVKDQADPAQNGIYETAWFEEGVSIGLYRRDFDSSLNVYPMQWASLVLVQRGTTNGNTLWRATTDASANPSFGSSAVTFVQLPSSVVTADTSAVATRTRSTVKAATIGEIDLTSAGGGWTTTIDSLAFSPGERLLVKDQTNPVENGVYVLADDSLSFTRAGDADAVGDIPFGVRFLVQYGTVNANTAWRLDHLGVSGQLTPGTDALVFVRAPIDLVYQSVRCAAAGPVWPEFNHPSTAAAPIFDGVQTVEGDRVLLAHEDDASAAYGSRPQFNGIFVVREISAGDWQLRRPTDLEHSAQLVRGAHVNVREGAVNGGSSFVLESDPASVQDYALPEDTGDSGAGAVSLKWTLLASRQKAVPTVRLCALTDQSFGSTPSGAQTIDGVAVADGDRVLLGAEVTGSVRGVWVADTAGPWARPHDALHAWQVAGVAFVVTEGDTLAGKVVHCTTTPSTSQDFSDVTLAFAELVPSTDATVKAVRARGGVRAATTENITLAPSPAAIDGVTLAGSDRVLVKDQTSAGQNGVYEFDGTDLVRASDWDSADECVVGAAFYVREGTTNRGTAWVNTSAVSALGTDAQLFAETPVVQFTYRKDAVDGSAGGAMSERSFGYAAQDLRAVDAVFVPDAALTADNTDFAVFSINGGAGGFGIASKNTMTIGGGGGGDMTQFQPWPLAIGEDTIPKGNVPRVSIAKTNAGVVVPSGVFVVSCVPWHSAA